MRLYYLYFSFFAPPKRSLAYRDYRFPLGWLFQLDHWHCTGWLAIQLWGWAEVPMRPDLFLIKLCHNCRVLPLPKNNPTSTSRQSIRSSCSVLSVLCGVTACFYCQSLMPVMLWEPSNKLLSKICGDCWAIRSEAEQCCFVSMQACSVMSVLCGVTACFYCQSLMPVMLWEPSNKLLSKICGDCWAIRSEQSNVVLSACRHAVSWVYCVGLLLVLLPERDACDALRTIK